MEAEKRGDVGEGKGKKLEKAVLTPVFFFGMLKG